MATTATKKSKRASKSTTASKTTAKKTSANTRGKSNVGMTSTTFDHVASDLLRSAGITGKNVVTRQSSGRGETVYVAATATQRKKLVAALKKRCAELLESRGDDRLHRRYALYDIERIESGASVKPIG